MTTRRDFIALAGAATAAAAFPFLPLSDGHPLREGSSAGSPQEVESAAGELKRLTTRVSVAQSILVP